MKWNDMTAYTKLGMCSVLPLDGSRFSYIAYVRGQREADDWVERDVRHIAPLLVAHSGQADGI